MNITDQTQRGIEKLQRAAVLLKDATTNTVFGIDAGFIARRDWHALRALTIRLNVITARVSKRAQKGVQ